MSSQLTISQVAKLAGVSTATVSRVLNNADCVKPETRDRVMKVISEYNYIPNNSARTLSTNSSQLIGVMVPDLENPFFLASMRGITQVADQYGYSVLLLNSDENPNKEHEILKVARGGNLAGLIASPVKCNDQITADILKSYESTGVPVVLLDRDLLDNQFCKVLADNEQGTYEAVRHLIRIGHKKIGLLQGDSEIFPVRERTKGYIRALEENNLPVREEYIMQCDQRSELAYHQMRFLMNRFEPPTAIFAANNMMTLGCLRYLTENNIQVGKDISLIGFDDIALLRSIGFDLSVVTRDEKKMGELAMNMLVNRMHGIPGASRCEMVPTHLILRGSEQYLGPQ